MWRTHWLEADFTMRARAAKRSDGEGRGIIGIAVSPRVVTAPQLQSCTWTNCKTHVAGLGS